MPEERVGKEPVTTDDATHPLVDIALCYAPEIVRRTRSKVGSGSSLLLVDFECSDTEGGISLITFQFSNPQSENPFTVTLERCEGVGVQFYCPSRGGGNLNDIVNEYQVLCGQLLLTLDG